MSLISYALSGNLKRFRKNIDVLAEQTGRKKASLMLDFLDCFIKMGCGYSDYLNYEIYNKSKEEKKEYVTIRDEDKFYEIVSPTKYKTFFTIKPNFLKNFSKYIARDFYLPETQEALDLFLNKHEYFMIKPLDGLGGQGVEKLYTKDITDRDAFYNKLKNERCFLEEYIKQNSKINDLCKASVNTIRIMTFSEGDHSEILFAGLRVGNGINSVDNFHQGGMGVLVDLKTGKLIGNAFNKDLVEYEYHPTSQIKFDGFQIPNWEYIRELVLEAALVNKNIHVVGWDVAVTEEGATFVEGNRRPGFDLVQVLYKRGKKDIMRTCLDQLNKANGTNYTI